MNTSSLPGQLVVPRVPGLVLDRVLARGASGIVWHALTAGGEHRAVKLLSADDFSAQEAALTRGRREPGLVTCYETYAVDVGGEAAYALVLEYAAGGTLASMVRGRGRLSPGESVTAMCGVAEALRSMHRSGLVHSDLSPGNVLFTLEGRPMLGDFTSVRVVGTRSGDVLGTPGHIAPEVLAGAEPSPASDVYSLGALAWFCRTGNPAPRTALRLSLDTVISHCGEALAAVIAACIDPDPEARPSAAEAAVLFHEAAPAEPLAVSEGTTSATMLTRRIREQAADDEPPTAPVNSRPRWWRWSAIATVVLAMSVGGVVKARSEGDHRGDGTRLATATPTMDAPAASAQAVLQRAVDHRASGLMNIDSPLGVAPESSAAELDVKLRNELRASGQRYAGLAYDVTDASWVRVQGRRATISAVVSTSRYHVRTDAESVVQDAQPGTLLHYDVVEVGGGWLISDVRPPG